jgi:hypothetical protein
VTDLQDEARAMKEVEIPVAESHGMETADSARMLICEAFFEACVQQSHRIVPDDESGVCSRFDAVARGELAADVLSRLADTHVPVHGSGTAPFRNENVIDYAQLARSTLSGGHVIVHAPTQSGTHRPRTGNRAPPRTAFGHQSIAQDLLAHRPYPEQRQGVQAKRAWIHTSASWANSRA